MGSGPGELNARRDGCAAGAGKRKTHNVAREHVQREREREREREGEREGERERETEREAEKDRERARERYK